MEKHTLRMEDLAREILRHFDARGDARHEAGPGAEARTRSRGADQPEADLVPHRWLPNQPPRPDREGPAKTLALQPEPLDVESFSIRMVSGRGTVAGCGLRPTRETLTP